MTGYTTTIQEDTQPQLPPTWGDPAILNHSTNLTPQQQQLLLLHLATNSITIVSDGSYHPDHQLGTAAWIIDLNNQTSIANGYYQCPGNNSDQSSYRSKLFGILGGMLHLLSCLDYNTDLHGQVKFYCDGKGAIDAITNKFPTANPSRLHYDIIQSIWSIIDKCNISWDFIHVKGHQDDLLDTPDLTRPEILNIQADNMAKTFSYHLLSSNASAIYPVLPFQRF